MLWDDFVAWFQSAAGQRVLDSAVIPALAILVAGVVAALIGRAAVRSLLARADRDQMAGVVAALVDTARVLAAGPTDRSEQERIDRLRTEGDVRLRLARPAGAALAAEWTSLRLDAIQRDGASPVRQATADADEVRERLLAWVARPNRAKRLFAADIERLAAERTARRSAPPTASTATPEPAEKQAPAPEPAAPTAAAAPEPAPASPGGSAEPPERRSDAQPEPVSARAHDRATEPLVPAGPQAPGRPPAEDGAVRPTSTEPVLIQRTRLESMDRPPVDPHLDHARHASADLAPATAAVPETEAPAQPEAAPEDRPAPSGQRQPTPAWLDTYDDEADVTRDIDLSKTPPPMSATAVRDRTRTGDDIVPRH